MPLHIMPSPAEFSSIVGRDACASPIRRIAAILRGAAHQSSRSSIAAQIASTSSICIEQGAGSDQ